MVMLILLACTSLGAQERKPLTPETALYSRAVRLSHGSAAQKGTIVVTVTSFPRSGPEEGVYESSNGEEFHRAGTIRDKDFDGGLCCGTLFELPAQVGSLQPGTLLWAGSIGDRSKTAGMQLKVFASSDRGATWKYLSNCASTKQPRAAGGGLWEPQFVLARDGSLVCLYSDETQPNHSQIIRQIRSRDGVTWTDASATVSTPVQADRPGMPVVTKLPSGRYFMTYEICGPPKCAVFFRTSKDGWHWGNPSKPGVKIVAQDGSWFEHAPTNVWRASNDGKGGVIMVIGQMTMNAAGEPAADNGHSMFVGSGKNSLPAWSVTPSLIDVPDARDNYCPNYSSVLLPLEGGRLLEFASDYVSDTCMMFYVSK